MSTDLVLFWNARGSVQPHRQGLGVHRLPEHTPRVHSHRGGGQCSQLWTQCAGCQSSTGGGGILTAGEKEKQWNELEVIVPTLLPTRLSETEMGVSLHALVYLIHHIHIHVKNEVSTQSLLMPNYRLPWSYHTHRHWEAKLIWGYWSFISFPPPTHFDTTHEQLRDLMQTSALLTSLHFTIPYSLASNRLILVLAFMHHGEQSVQTSKRMCTSYTVSVPSCDEAAPQSHEVFTHCALNPAVVIKNLPCQYLMRIYSWRWLQLHHCSIRKKTMTSLCILVLHCWIWITFVQY